MVQDIEQVVPAQPSLHDRLGGVYNIATVADDLIDRVMVDPRLNANPRVDEAHHQVSVAGFKYLVTEMVCWAAGGPQHYSGRSMGDSHRHLMITAEEWLAFVDDLQQTLDKFGVPQPEQDELKAIVRRSWSRRCKKAPSRRDRRAPADFGTESPGPTWAMARISIATSHIGPYTKV